MKIAKLIGKIWGLGINASLTVIVVGGAVLVAKKVRKELMQNEIRDEKAK